ncbi:thiamine pyrophosphate-binding protein [Conexibacter sp. CPCC 206217]|uniref:thiamine pyrophosphate-binding protein n=1 Tax=Conexibacter sp. CPCC 206217 TaxID=3064574 RepID=UPI00271C1DAC|nr:thiamine pyrophosphate-dependent enzyme [Conexibacter sp. CPCC 206217]MDO8210237.1 thiamine pyrophosphate-binding protein [Conexibacter sp. CPCC 206217]
MAGERLNAAEAACELLAAAGVRRCYTVPGESFLGLLLALADDPRIEVVSTRHESGAAFMADAEARLTGGIAVALASRAPGSSNLAIGVQTAHEDGTPLLAILGQVPVGRIGSGALQEIDLAAFYAPITKWAVTARTSAELPALLARALRVAREGRPGPVAVAVPEDLWQGVAGPLDARGVQPRQASAADPSALDAAAAALAAARQPVMIAGGGAAHAREQLVALAERAGLGVLTAFRRQNVFPDAHPNCIGQLVIATPPQLLAPALEADLLLLAGTRLDDLTGQQGRLPQTGQRVLSIGPDSALPPDAEGLGEDVAETLQALLDRLPDRTSGRDWSDAHGAYHAAAQPPPSAGDGAGVDPARAVAALHRAIGGAAIVTNDAGNFSAFLHRHWRFEPGGALLAPANGAMGYAVPAAVAAKLADPAARVVAVVGDGGALMTGQELETAVRCGADILVVVFQNGLYGTIAMHEARAAGRVEPATEIGLPDFGRWATALGAHGWTVRTESQLEAALQAAQAMPGPALVAVRTDPDLIAPGVRLAELLASPPSRGER